MTASASPPTGIAAFGLHLPPLCLDVRDLATVRGEEPAKYTVGLGCHEMALCSPGFGVVDLATEATRRALERWVGQGGDPERIGLLAVGSESAVDMSRPLSAWVADGLGLAGSIRSYEVKHACYGGTVALRQAVEWRLSGAARGRAALVVATDVALYAPADPGEPTQGAGAVAMVIDEPAVAAIDPVSHPWSEPAFDFWRPVGEAFPRVDGPFSLECYKRAAENCFAALVGDRDPEKVLAGFAALCFHVPFPKMVKKTVIHVGERFGFPAETTERIFARQVDPTMGWNRRIGNAYTASLWFAVAEALCGRVEGERIAAFSYGSGFGSELLALTAGPAAAAGAWAEDVERDFSTRRRIDAQEYLGLRG